MRKIRYEKVVAYFKYYRGGTGLKHEKPVGMTVSIQRIEQESGMLTLTFRDVMVCPPNRTTIVFSGVNLIQ
jgi:hypothetical protein